MTIIDISTIQQRFGHLFQLQATTPWYQCLNNYFRNIYRLSLKIQFIAHQSSFIRVVMEIAVNYPAYLQGPDSYIGPSPLIRYGATLFGSA